MSETITRPVPAGIDTLSADESALLDSMRDSNGDDIASLASTPDAPEAVELPAADEPDDTGDVTEQRSKTVPHQAFHAEREARKQAQAEAREAKQQAAVEMARAQTRLELLTQAVQAATATPAAAAPAVEIPDVAVDPVGHFQAIAEQQRRELADLKAMTQGFQQAQQQQAAVQELRSWATSQEVEFMARENAYADAMKYMREGRHAELEAAGVVDIGERERIINGDVTQIALRARQEGVNFAERLFNIAQKRGYSKAAVIPPLDAAVAPPPAAERAERGRANSLTIGSAGAAPPPALTAEKLASMSDRDFTAMYEKLKANPAALRQYMGA
jgi:hypothetical protein